MWFVCKDPSRALQFVESSASYSKAFSSCSWRWEETVTPTFGGKPTVYSESQKLLISDNVEVQIWLELNLAITSIRQNRFTHLLEISARLRKHVCYFHECESTLAAECSQSGPDMSCMCQADRLITLLVHYPILNHTKPSSLKSIRINFFSIYENLDLSLCLL